MAGDAVRVNGRQIDWGSVRLRINGTPYYGFTAIEFSDGLEVSHAYGAGRHRGPRGRTAGKYMPEPLVLTCWRSTTKQIREDLAAEASDGRSYGSVIIPISVQYIEPDDAEVSVDAEECKLIKIETSDEEGPDGLSDKLTFHVMRYRFDGLTQFDSSEEAGA